VSATASEAIPAPRKASESVTEMVQLVLPNDTNPLGFVLGGTVMHWIDVVAAITSHRHARRLCVTASMDDLSFEAPIPMGHVAHLKARVTHTSRSSLEVRVDVESENLSTGVCRHTSTAFVTFVAIDDQGRPVPVPPLIPGPEDEAEHAAAVIRYRERQQRRAARGTNPAA
jgi:acyl-CoA hydrolase